MDIETHDASLIEHVLKPMNELATTASQLTFLSKEKHPPTFDMHKNRWRLSRAALTITTGTLSVDF